METWFFTTSDDEWDRFFEKLPNDKQHVCFSRAYHKLFEENGDGKAELFICEKNGNIYFYPYIKNKIKQVGEFYFKDTLFDIQSVFGYTGPINNSCSSDFVLEANHEFVKYCIESNILVEFIRFNPLLKNYLELQIISDLDIIKLKKFVFITLTKDLCDIENDFKRTLKQQIRKAEALNLKCYMNNHLINCNDIFKLYLKRMKEVNADEYYLFSRNYFNMLGDFIKSGYGNVFYARDIEDKLLASNIFVFNKNTVYWLHSMRDINDGRSSLMNILLTYNAIKYFKEKGFSFFLLGGGKTDLSDDALLRFKKNFSYEYSYFNIGKRVFNKDIYDKICKSWELAYPHLIQKRKNYILKYNYTK